MLNKLVALLGLVASIITILKVVKIEIIITSCI